MRLYLPGASRDGPLWEPCAIAVVICEAFIRFVEFIVLEEMARLAHTSTDVERMW